MKGHCITCRYLREDFLTGGPAWCVKTGMIVVPTPTTGCKEFGKTDGLKGYRVGNGQKCP